MGTNCDLLERIGEHLVRYGHLKPIARTSEDSRERHILTEAQDRIIMLERIVDRYGDKARMAWCPEAEMQFVIDVALENQAGRKNG